MTPDIISPDLKTVLRRLKLSRMLDTLPERLALARQQKMPHQDFLLLVLADEATRRDSQAATLRAQRARLDPTAARAWDETAEGHLRPRAPQRARLAALPRAHHHVAIVGPVGVGKTFLAHALGHIACRRGYSVLALRADAHAQDPQARPPHSDLRGGAAQAARRRPAHPRRLRPRRHGRPGEPRRLRDLIERHRAGSMIVTSNRGPDEWLATFADPVRAQGAIDRFTSNAYDLVIEGESYRARLKPGQKAGQRTEKKAK